MKYRLLDERSLVFDGADPFEVSDYVNRHVGVHRIRLPGSAGRVAGLRHRKAGLIDLCRITYGGPVRVVSTGLADVYHLQIILRGHCRYEISRESHDFSSGDILLLNPDDPIDLTYSDDCEKFILKIPASLLDDVCIEQGWLRPREGIKFIPIRYQLHEIESLMNLLVLLCQEAESEAGSPAQIFGHYNWIVANKLLTLLKHNIRREFPTLQSCSFERLVQYIDENIKRDISVEELARVSHMSLRSLYLLFERYTDTTPKNYIKRRKLERIHATLIDPANTVRSVTAVALDYGFTHLGRFSEFYKATFGVLPSDTLKRR
ncbi:MAG: AraC family transcriptional regulator [Proteobacteria bacterium]|nr:AraC family transcriptional regulator [Pseudomonadota bacterium]MBS0555440.1 AraC family transcriptional regulator [Pseudomonadota bacterium]